MAVVCVCPSVCPVCDAKLRTEGHRKLKIGTNKTYDMGHLEVKGSRSPGCLTQRPKIGHIFRMARPTNFKFGINDGVRWPTSTTCAVSDLQAESCGWLFKSLLAGQVLGAYCGGLTTGQTADYVCILLRLGVTLSLQTSFTFLCFLLILGLSFYFL